MNSDDVTKLHPVTSKRVQFNSQLLTPSKPKQSVTRTLISIAHAYNNDIFALLHQKLAPILKKMADSHISLLNKLYKKSNSTKV